MFDLAARFIPSCGLDGHGQRDALNKWIHTGKGDVEPTNVTNYAKSISRPNIVCKDDVSFITLKNHKHDHIS